MGRVVLHLKKMSLRVWHAMKEATGEKKKKQLGVSIY